MSSPFFALGMAGALGTSLYRVGASYRFGKDFYKNTGRRPVWYKDPYYANIVGAVRTASFGAGHIRSSSGSRTRRDML